MDAVQIGGETREGHGLPSPVPAARSARHPKRIVSELLATMEGLSAGQSPERLSVQESAQQQIRILERVLEESPNGMLRLDTTGTVLYANPAAAAFLAACGGGVGQRLASHLGDAAREACEFGMVRAEEVEVAASLYDVTFAPQTAAGYVNVYAVDITRRRLAEDAARDAGRKLQRSMEQAIDMLARALEKRDPATSAHQKRVALIAAAIGSEMGLPADRIEGLRLGASIHDIGKIHTPADLLARPGKLVAAEIEWIRQHPVNGYDIVKDVAFPWPVAEIVLQHHERMDGSGYPRGLKGEEILLEARILAVADVVEGMSAHRPYRPALGLDAALREIERMRERWLDAAAVDACLRLFREKGFSLPA